MLPRKPSYTTDSSLPANCRRNATSTRSSLYRPLPAADFCHAVLNTTYEFSGVYSLHRPRCQWL